jgi:hypothetical protein
MRRRFTVNNGAIEKRSSAALRCKPYRSTYANIYASRFGFLRALHLNIFEQLQNIMKD